MSSWAETWWETPDKIDSEWLKQFFSDIKDGQTLISHLEILQTTSFFIICSLQQRRLSEIVAIPGHTHLFFALAYLFNEIGGLCNGGKVACIINTA